MSRMDDNKETLHKAHGHAVYKTLGRAKTNKQAELSPWSINSPVAKPIIGRRSKRN